MSEVMIIDSRSLPNKNDLNCELCIIGGGAAGIALALEFSNSGVEVLLLESGGFEPEEETQALYQGDDIGLPYSDVESNRLRYFGGTTNHWSGWCRPLEPIDFEYRDWINHSGWPISYGDFSNYLPRANKLVEIENCNYYSQYWLETTSKITGRNYYLDKQHLQSLDSVFDLGMFQFSPPTLFGKTYRKTLYTSTNIKVLLNANVKSIDTLKNPNRVDQISVSTLNGKQFNVHPKVVVLATGGIENARILLASNQTHINGIGNGHDLVGRYFADHVELKSGYIVSNNQSNFLDLFAERQDSIRFSLDLSSKIQREKKLTNLGFTLHKVPNLSQSSDGVGASRRLKKSIEKKEWPKNFFSDVGKTVMDIDDVIMYMRSKDSPPKKGLYILTNRLETQPNPNSRISLSDEVDALGMPRVKVNWQLSEIDYHSTYTMQSILGQLLGKNDYGRINIELSKKFDGWPDMTYGGNHHMGTTRMSNHPSQGVVDKNCKVFGMENLYIAGSSLFPTYGKANPTLNLLALALRLSDHLKEKGNTI